MLGADDPEFVRRARSFGARARAYARGRPGYPADALRFCLAAGARRVLDLGAGTGQVTRGLLALGVDVVAVEPLPEMRALIPPPAVALAGSAEAIPLDVGAVDAVLVGQAFHWFDRERALAEIARVLRPGGTLGVLWNWIEGDRSWVPAVAEVVREASHLVEPEPPYTDSAPFDVPMCKIFAYEEDFDADGLVANVASRSVVINMSREQRAEVLARVRALAPAGRFQLPLRCAAWRGERQRM